MRSKKRLILVDWISSSLRWIILLGLALSLSRGDGAFIAALLVLIFAGMWNLILTAFVMLNRRIRFHTWICISLDAMIGLLLFSITGGIESTVAWSGLLAVISVAVYFQLIGAIIGVAVITLLQAIIAVWLNHLVPALLGFIGLFPVYLSIGMLIGSLVWRLLEKFSLDQQLEFDSKLEPEKNPNQPRRSIYKIISLVNASLNYQRVLDTALDISAEALASTNHIEEDLVSAVMLFKGESNNGNQRLYVGSARRFTPSDLRIELSGKSGLIGTAVERCEACVSNNLNTDPELGRIVALRSCASVYCIPLHNGLDAYGVLLFGHSDKNFFSTSHREILDMIGSQAMVAIQNARLYRDLEVEKERILEIQEEARKKLARDLHDGPTQSVSALAMRANFARRLLERDEKAAAEELFKLEEMARRTTKEIRHMLFTLRPLVLESQGLVAAFESMAEKMRDTYNQNVIIQADPHIVSEIEAGKQAVIFYIAEEAVNNARKHAQAEHIWVRIKNIGDDLVMLEIEDDGQGFDIHATRANYENQGSLGMVNMRERTDLVNGLLKIESKPGEGTRIRVVIPITEDAADRLRRNS